MPATDDAALARLLDEVIDAARTQGRVTGHPSATVQHRAIGRKDAARAALLAYLGAHYVRRDRLYDDGPFDPGDGSAYGDALAREGAPGA